ncbi:MAG: HipA N-terminal domain-containing protein, partial [Bacteroidaceae bacterium]|nr:HipA N-terminal domain-containing protein [Bacteroidaceae bacterium]
MNSIKQIEVIYNNSLVGRLALTKEGLCAFEYSSGWLTSGFSISPFELPLRSGVFVARPRPFDGGFGVFDDSLPDGWGQLILDRYLQLQGINPRTLTILDRLALVGSTGRGALEFRPDKSVVTEQEYADFEKLALEAERILDSDDYAGEGIEEFQQRGGSPGGARPKIFTR